MPNTADNAKTSSDIEHVDWSTGTGGSGHYTNVRFGSGSSQASQNSGDICRICHCESDPQNPLLTPCYCSGSLKYVHQACLQQWLTASETNACELCKFPFIMHTKIKPFNEWRSLDISGIERRRLCCSLLFHCAAALCVIWSLCVLIERAADDVQRGLIDWPFWTKLAVVTVGMTGGIVFMYIQCKAYLHLCHRWKARNRILLIQNAPEKIHPLSPPSPMVQNRNRRCSSLGGEARPSDREHTGTCAGAAVEIGDNLAGPISVSGYGYTCSGAGSGAGINVAAGDINETRAAATNSSLLHHHHHNGGGGGGGGGSGAGGVGSGVCISSRHNSHAANMSASPNHMLPHADLDVDSLNTQASSSSAIGLHPSLMHHGNHHNHHHQHQLGLGSHPHSLGQVAVAANIECSQSQHNYERDWALDDVVSQISSFRPCPQGSGSMTPFHDSIHNVLEHSEECSSRDSRQNLSASGFSSELGREHALQLSSFSGSGEHKAPSIGSGASSAVANGLGGFAYKPHNKRYSNSSIFLENRDILNDPELLGMELTSSDFPKMTYRNPSDSPDGGIIAPGLGRSCSDISAGSDEQRQSFLNKNRRRFSDPKLIPDASNIADMEAQEPMLPNACDVGVSSITPPQYAQRNSRIQAKKDTVLDMELPLSPLTPPALYAGEQQRRERQKAFHQMHRSMQTVDLGFEIAKQTQGNNSSKSSNANRNPAAGIHHDGENSSRVVFKSLPNLSSSCENLLKK